ncbi:MAG: RNA polymerase sigma-54 factor, partial [Deltaproteobacteria bacterium]|nr:RNA polymerase sigma-54 factor [Deltaproteobacteria bacterium]
MALQLRQSLKLSQQLVMTPQLQQAIKMLQLSRLELLQTIRQELEENAILEMEQDEDIINGDKTTPEDEIPPPVSENDFTEVRVEEKVREDIDWESYLSEYSSSSVPSMREIPEESNYEAFISEETSLSDHLTWQWRMSDPSPKEDRIANQIIGNLNRDGYLQIDLEEIADIENVTVKEVESVLAKVQDLDPVGVAARDLRECLLIQLKHLNQQGSLAEKVVDECLLELEKKNYQKIARKLKTTKEKVFEAVEIILNLDPKPGRAYSTEEPQYITPDVYVYKVGDEYVIVLNEDGLPRLKVNQY